MRSSETLFSLLDLPTLTLRTVGWSDEMHACTLASTVLQNVYNASTPTLLRLMKQGRRWTLLSVWFICAVPVQYAAGTTSVKKNAPIKIAQV